MDKTGETSKSGFVYVATGERYVAEAAASAASLRRHHVANRVCLITDQPRGTPFWDDLVVIEQPNFGFRDKLAMQRAPYDRCVFLDTDTFVCGDLSPLFEILRHYDVCGVHLSEGQDYVMPGIPAAFPEMNGGIIGFCRSPATQEFFSLWEKYYDEFYSLSSTGAYHYANVGDQKSLRAALWNSRVRHAAIGAEFNFIPFRMELVSLPVAMVHTRHTLGVKLLAQRLNAQVGRRTYSPELDVVVGPATSRRELRRLTAAVLRLWCRICGRELLPPFLRRQLLRLRGVRRVFFGNPFANPVDPVGDRKWERP